MSNPWQRLTFQLFLFVVLPLTTLVIVLLLGSLTLHEQAMRMLVGERNARAARAAAAAITEQLNHRTQTLHSLALYAQTGDISPILAEADWLTADFEGGVALFNRQGDFLAATPNVAFDATPLLAQLTTQTPVIFSVPFTNTNASQVLLAVRADTYIAVGAFTPATLAERGLAEAFGTASATFVAVIAADNQPLYTLGPLPTDSDLAHHTGVLEAQHGESGVTYLPVAGDEHVVAYAPIAPVGWALIIEEPWAMVDNPLLSRTQIAPLLLIPLLVFALVVIGFGLRQIVQPLNTLEKQAQALAWGDYTALTAPIGGIAEIQRLQAELRRMAEKVQSAQQNLRGYLNAITAGQEEERRRLARELHDGTVQALVALDQRLQLAQRATPAAAEKLGELRQMTTTLLEEVRRIIRALRPIYLEDLGLLAALETLARELEQTATIPANLRVTFTQTGTPRRLTPAQEMALYRIAQEALTNSTRYAQARTVQVTAAFSERVFTLQVQDDGVGFNAPVRVSDLVQAGHYGLMGMHERAELIGARLVIDSAPNNGTRIEVKLPLGE